MKKKIYKTEFEIDEAGLKAKVLNPIEGIRLIDQHIYPDTNNACISIERNRMNTLELFLEELDKWAYKHWMLREYGIWYEGHSHDLTEAAKELVYKKLNTNSISVKRLITIKEFNDVIELLLDDMRISKERKAIILESWEEEKNETEI